ncbi:MAG: 23S rRNA (pseudouridine(1915)-N(3))-methyltransferase RlmH [Betaproteobacteria bacterium]|nr:23S rRNA (pseudouridine(1915)-N(3))-methyltransferase RlmH [Betaproteobacteria bacterium]NBY05872.1 23S rRNA (pseudouridine(1915)-N(3))-methyltransferase RlmH [Betaproteobacteria bacterium]
MKLWVVAVGQRTPDWAQSAWDDFAKRFPPEWPLTLKAVKTEPRHKVATDKFLQAERKRLESAIPKDAWRIALDERGQSVTTQSLAQQLRGWQGQGRDVAFIIGGPDGLDPQFKDQAHQLWRLSDLTLPHALARVLLIEQLYRAISVLSYHPYHRE